MPGLRGFNGLPKRRTPEQTHEEKDAELEAFEAELLSRFEGKRMGRHTAAVDVPGDDKVVAALPVSAGVSMAHGGRYHYESFPAKIRFYEQRILHTLFPENFPAFSFAIENPNPKQNLRGLTLRDKTEGEEVAPKEFELQDALLPRKERDRRLASAMDGLRVMGFRQESLGMDTSTWSKGFDFNTPRNVVRSEEGSEAYRDTGQFHTSQFLRNRKKIEAYMRHRPGRYSAADRTKVSAAIDRLEALGAKG